jgi:hypothetical protein
MTKKSLLMLVLAVVIAGSIFAQSFASMPKNTVTVDVGPTIVGLALGQAGNLMGNIAEGLPKIDSTGFGIAVQYERQVLAPLGVAARFAYLGAGLNGGLNLADPDSEATANTSARLDIKTISAEAHARFYPFAGRTFFLGGLVGFGNLSMDGNLTVKVSNAGQIVNDENVNASMQRNYAKVGAKIGWRMDFGRPGGFVFEPSFGYDHAIGLGKTFTTQLQENITGGTLGDVGDLDQVFNIIESYALVGGPRLTLGFGWRF